MTEKTTASAVEGMRALTSQIDQSIETLLEAHGFVFTEITATGDGDGAVAIFSEIGQRNRPNWQLTFRQSFEGLMSIVLSLADKTARSVCLTIQIDGKAASTAAQAVGLAMSLIVFAQQLKDAK